MGTETAKSPYKNPGLTKFITGKLCFHYCAKVRNNSINGRMPIKLDDAPEIIFVACD
jgi:hypothetical protein